MYVAGSFRAPVVDKVAFAVGDVVVVEVLEVSEGESGADRSSASEAGFDVNARKSNREESVGLDLRYGAAHEGLSRREGRLKARVSARVVEVDDFGLLKLVGRQLIVVNGKEQLIVLSGWARAVDIAGDNSILSSRLADAVFRYEGVEPKRKPWFKRVFNFFWND